MTEKDAYQRIAKRLIRMDDRTEQGTMFGKECLKVNGKAFAAFHQKRMVFKLTGKAHEKALRIKGAKLWDPSGKKRPMKEWIQVPYAQASSWSILATSAQTYVESST